MISNLFKTLGWLALMLCVLAIVPAIQSHAGEPPSGVPGPNDIVDDENEDCPKDEDLNFAPTDPGSPATPAPQSCPPPESCGVGQLADGACGMPVWRVSEPFINLWVKDTPLFYTMSNGKRMQFTLTYRQRNTNWNANIWSVGKGWECSWKSFMNVTNSDNQMLNVAGGGKRLYTPGFVETVSISEASTDGSGSSATHTISFRSHAANTYQYQMAQGTNSTNFFLSSKKDSLGRSNNFTNETVSGIVRLKTATDIDGKTSTLAYGHSTLSNLVTSVVDPHGRTAYLKYDSSGQLTNIVDVKGITNSFQYDAQGLITHMITPYGTTQFQATTNSYETMLGGTNQPNRSLLVTLPNGSKERFAYVDNFPALMPASLSNVPSLPPGDHSNFASIFNSHMAWRNSFHWNSKQLDDISHTWPSFTTNDYLRATMKHWLGKEVEETKFTSQILTMRRDGSLDGTTPGQETWYNPDPNGTLLPSQVSQLLPDGTTHYVAIPRNQWGRPTSIVENYGDGSQVRVHTFEYDSATERDLLSHSGPNDEPLVAYSYDSDHRITQITDPLGTTAYTYNSANRNVATVLYPSGLLVTNVFEPSGTYAGWVTTRFAKPASASTNYFTNTFSYTGGQVYTVKDARDLTITNYWDNLQRLVGRLYPEGTISNRFDRVDGTSFPDSSGTSNLLSLTATKDLLGNWTYFKYNELQQLTAVTNALTNITTLGYCDCGLLESITDANAKQVLLTSDPLGRVINVHYDPQISIDRTFNSLGQVVKVTDAYGATTNHYNNQGLICASSNVFGQVFKVQYDIFDRVSNSVDSTGASVSYAYDLAGRITNIIESAGGTNSFGYTPNVLGPTSYTNQLGSNIILWSYDALGRVSSAVQKDVATVSFQYAPAGDLTGFTDGNNHTTLWTYDKYGRVKTRKDAANNQWTYTYDANGRLTSRLDALSRTTSYGYDLVGNLANIVYPSRTNTYSYDKVNRLSAISDPFAGLTTFTHQGSTFLSVLKKEDGPWTSDEITYSFDHNGAGTTWLRNAMSIQAPNSSSWNQAYLYDAAGRLSLLGANTTWAYDYVPDLNGITNSSPLVKKLNPQSRAYVTNVYDNLGRLTDRLLKNTSHTLLDQHSYAYNSAHQRTSQTRTDGSVTDYTYDLVGQLVKASAHHGTTNRWQEQFGYGYDPAGNLTTRTNYALTLTVGNNSLNQLTSISRSGNLAVAGFTTAAATEVKVNQSTTTNTATRYADNTFVSTNWSLSAGANSFTAIATDSSSRKDTNTVSVDLPSSVSYLYDANGNLTNDVRRKFTYDDENQLTSVTVTNGVNNSTKTEFVYDGLGRRRIKKEHVWIGSSFVQNGETRYIYDGLLVVQERDAFNLPKVTYTRGPDLSGSLQGAGGIGGLLARTDHGNGTTAYYHSDGSGNVTMLTDAYQHPVAKYLYDPFGNTLTMAGPLAEANTLRFSSQEYHQNSGLSLYTFRAYDANLQRFTSADPIGESGGANLYGFVGNNPVSGIDLYGLHWTDWIPDLFVFGDYEGPGYMSPGGRVFKSAPSTDPSFRQMDMIRDAIGGYDPSGLQAAAGFLRAGAELNPIVGGFNSGFTACTGQDAVSREGVGTASRVQAGAQTAGMVFGGCLSLAKRATEAVQITVIGSRADTLAAKAWPGYNVLDIPNWSAKANIRWLDSAIRRGDEIYLATDPAKHRAYLDSLPVRPFSGFLDLELPYLQSKGYIQKGLRMVRAP